MWVDLASRDLLWYEGSRCVGSVVVELWCMGLVARKHVGSSWTRN